MNDANVFAQCIVAMFGFSLLIPMVAGFFNKEETEAMDDFMMTLEETECEYLARKAGYYRPLF